MASVTHEKRLSWHPRRENQFIVSGGSHITLYDWSPESRKFSQVASHHDLQSLKCFAWSPDAVYNDLVAVAYGSSKVDVLRLKASKESYGNMLSGGPRVSLPVGRTARACNSLAFSPTAPNLLAAGLDKVRSEGSLVVWDLEVASTLLSERQLQEPSDERRVSVLYQLASQESVTCATFVPQSTGLLLAGMSQRWLRLYDLRRQGAMVMEVPSKVQVIKSDPFDHYRVACLSDGAVTIWDWRKLQAPLLTFTDRDASADGARPRPNGLLSEAQFSQDRRGSLVTLVKDANSLRLWNLIESSGPSIASIASERRSERPKDANSSSRLSRLTWAPWKEAKDTSTTEPASPSSLEPLTIPTPYDLILANTRATKDFTRPISSFSIVPSRHATHLMEMMIVNREGGIELHSMHDTAQQQTWSARGDLSLTLGGHYRTVPGYDEDESPPEPWDIEQVQPEASPPLPVKEVTPTTHGMALPSVSVLVDRPGFGRGDHEGFPALGYPQVPSATQTRRESSISRTRHMKGRTYSPASVRRIPIDRSNNSEVVLGDAGASPTIGKRNAPADPSGREDPGGIVNSGQLVDDPQERNIAQRSWSSQNDLTAVTGDISMIMRSRAVQGYGMSSPSHNATIVQHDRVLGPDDQWSSSLTDMWKWIHYSQQLLPPANSKLHGFDFANQGVLGIWEGIEPSPPPAAAEDTEASTVPNSPTGLSPDFSVLGPLSPRPLQQQQTLPIGYGNGSGRTVPDSVYGDFHAAVKALISKNRVDRSWAPKVATGPHKVAQRRLAVALCGWSLGDDELQRKIRKWENAGKTTQAACWMVFTNRSNKAVDLLQRSSYETHVMVAGMLAALLSQPDPVRGSARQHWEGIIRKLKDPYIRAMLIYVALGNWTEVLREGDIPLRERLAIAFRFLDDSALTTYLRSIKDGLRSTGDVEGLVITGLTPLGLDILQVYVDRTGDVQTAAILSSYICARYKDSRMDRWLEAYRDLLDGWKLFHHRCQLDIERGRILREAYHNGDVVSYDWFPEPQILLRCGYCNQVVNPQTAPDGIGQQRRATVCPSCARSLPRCVICLMNISVLPDGTRNLKLSESPLTDTIDEAVVFCQSCRHGGHASHILDWFFGEEGHRSHGVCAVANCNCRCADEL